jgi:POT family proton-dependent oligopeptide transporter
VAISTSVWDIKAKKNQYIGAYLLLFSVFTERFSFWGLQAILVLFLIQSFSLEQKSAFALVGTFGALSYASALLGGIVADKLIGM